MKVEPSKHFNQCGPNAKVEAKKPKLASCIAAKTTTPAEIIANRFEEAGHQRYPAHRLRHAAAQMAVKRAKSTIELKAISQCFGHTTVSLMLSTYGDLNSTQLDEISLNLGNHEKTLNVLS